MNNIWVRIIGGGILLLALQVLVLNGLDISAFFYPQVYILIILALPVNTQHWVLMLSGFFIGYFVDWFSDTQGLHAASLTFMGYLRYGYLKNVMDKEAFNSGIRPTLGNVELAWYIIYLAIFVVIFHFTLFFLADFSFAHFGETMLKTMISSSVAMLFILIVNFVFNSRVKNV